MIRLSKIRAVATFEFLSTIRRKAYIITTIGMPLFLALYGGIVSIPGYFISQKESETKVYGLIDESGVLGLDENEELAADSVPPEARAALDAAREIAGPSGTASALMFGNAIFRAVESAETARAAVLEGALKGYYVFPEDFLERGHVSFYRAGGGGITDFDGPSRPLRALIIDRLIEDRLDGALAQRVRVPVVNTETFAVSQAGVSEPESDFEEIARLAIPIIFAMLLFTSLMMSASYLIQAIAVEKENKVVEVLLSSANPDEILFGKLLGLGTAGMIQVAVWYGVLLAGGVVFAGALAAFGVEVPWMTIVLAVVLFVVAYMFLGSLMLGTGSLGNNARESQQLSMVWTLLSVVPMMLLGIYLAEPNGVVAQVLTWIPFTAPLSLLLRMSMEPEGVRWWEIVGCLAMMAVSIWIAVRLSARLFRVGLLLTGARPKLREILRQARLAA